MNSKKIVYHYMDICPKCNKTVGFAEKMFALEKVWHIECFQCKRCRKVLQPGKQSDNGGDLYCHACYSRKFGPKGIHKGIVMETCEGGDHVVGAEIDRTSKSFSDIRKMFEKK